MAACTAPGPCTKLGGWPASVYGEDAHLLLTFSACGRVAIEPEFVLRYRQHAGQATQSPEVLEEVDQYRAFPNLCCMRLRATTTGTPPPVPPKDEARIWRVHAVVAADPGRAAAMLYIHSRYLRSGRLDSDTPWFTRF
jgi:hypothetical protein